MDGLCSFECVDVVWEALYDVICAVLEGTKEDVRGLIEGECHDSAVEF
jgi:hypothetical protein